MGLLVHGEAAALPGGERRRSPVDAVADQRVALLSHIRRRMAEQANPRCRRLIGALSGGGFRGGMAHAAPVGAGDRWPPTWPPAAGAPLSTSANRPRPARRCPPHRRAATSRLVVVGVVVETTLERLRYGLSSLRGGRTRSR